MNQKRLISIILIVLAAILIGIVGYFALIKKPTPPFTTKETFTTTSPTPEKIRSYDLKFNRDYVEGLFRFIKRR
jgi:Flp pilus assembly protein CpaB